MGANATITCICYAIAAGAMAVTKMGAQSAMTTEAELMALLENGLG